MRIYLRLSKNKKVIPFNYQELLTGVVHKWIGKNNNIHGKTNQFSFSWLQNTVANKRGIDLRSDAYFFISSINPDLIKQIVKNILQHPEMFNGVRVIDVQIKNIPNFGMQERFLMASPVLLKLKNGKENRHVTIEDEDFENVLTNSLKTSLKKANIPSDSVRVSLDPDSNYRKTKLVTYNGIGNKSSLAPIIIEGKPEQIAYAWCNGLGNSTGIGFGSIK